MNGRIIRNSIYGLFIGLVLLATACSSSTSTVQSLPSPSPTKPLPSPSPTIYPSPTHKPTLTPQPSHTVTSTRLPTSTLKPTSTLTPLILPGMAGFQPSPTYDARFLQTATPASPPPCPVVDPDLPLTADLAKKLAEYYNDYPNISLEVLDYLNQGGSLEILIQAIEAVNPNLIDQQDLTNDGQVELLLRTKYLTVIGCDPVGNAQYTILGKFIDAAFDVPPMIDFMQDLNQNGLPELLLTSEAFMGFSTTRLLQVVEWDGYGFSNILGLAAAYPYRTLAETQFSESANEVLGLYFEPGQLELMDADGNGTTEIIVHNGLPGHPDTFAHGPWRGGRDILTWNGEAFVLLRSEIDPPVYRFQAVYDADQAALLGEYDEALRIYQEAIFSDKLKGWSPELSRQQFDIKDSRYYHLPTPTPYPAPAEEYYHLAAYARFRILLLHALLGNTVEAQTVYDTLQSKFPEGQPGYESARLAQTFWQTFQSTQDVGQTCNQALESMANPDEIIYWLSGYHGWQFPSYQPVDLCPFGQTGSR